MTLIGLLNFPKFPKAKCLIVDPDFFFPTSQVELEERLPQLQHYCGTCVYQADCLTYAIDNKITDGYWAGHSSDQLKTIWKGKDNSRTNNALGDILHNLSLGFTKEETAKILGIQMASLERTLARSKQKGLK